MDIPVKPAKGKILEAKARGQSRAESFLTGFPASLAADARLPGGWLLTGRQRFL